MNMKNLKILSFILLLFGCSNKNFSERPNIIFIMSDDHAVPAVSSYNGFLSNVFKTPNLDRIAKEGAIFKNAYCTNSICTPARASVLTGKYSNINGVFTLNEKISDSQNTFPKELQKTGYYTGMIGKWHLHTEPKGFDYWKVMIGQGLYHNPIYCEMGKGWSPDPEDGTGVKYEGYVTDINTDFAIDFLDKRPKEKPFMMMLHYKAPHDEWEHSEKYSSLFEDIDLPEPETLYDDYSTRGYGIYENTQKIGENHTFYEEETGHLNGRAKKGAQYQTYIKKYLRCVASIDENIGRVLKYLDENNLTENTIVIYTSDQGFYLGEHGMYDKRFMYEESLQIPFLMRYPKKIKPGTINDDIISNVDFAPTILDFAGNKIPSDIQGKSFTGFFDDSINLNWRQSLYYRYWMHGAHFNIPGHYGIRTKDFKLIYFYAKGLGYSHERYYPSENWVYEGNEIKDSNDYWEMYDLINDPNELNNIYDNPNYKKIKEELKNQLFDLKKYYKDTDESFPELYTLTKKYSD